MVLSRIDVNGAHADYTGFAPRDNACNLRRVKRTKASATRIALTVLTAARGHALSAAQILAAGELLDCSPNAMRVALSRLLSEGSIAQHERGQYVLGGTVADVGAHVRAWRTGFAKQVAWKGRFIAVLVHALPHRDRTSARRRDRALALAGFRAWKHGVVLRPDNLAGGRIAIAQHLAKLGLDPDAPVVGLELDDARTNEVFSLWDVAQDRARALALEADVQAFVERMEKRPAARVAAESFWLGDEVVRFLARDPLLPEAVSDPGPRRALAKAMSVLDERGVAIWWEILMRAGGAPDTRRQKRK